MPHYAVSRHIAAPPSTIWPILTNARQLADGSFSILRIDGEIAAGKTIKLWSEVDPKRSFAIKVSDVQAEAGMTWSNGLPLGLFRGARRFSLKPAGQGTTFEMREDYTGPLANLMFRMIPNLQPSFEKFADALKSAAEGQTP